MRAPNVASMQDVSRHVTFEACFNFRDLGGYETAGGRTVRWNQLYRSDTLHRLTPTDIESLRALGLRTVIDLRSETEVDDHGGLPGAVEELVRHHVPMLDNIRLAPVDEAELEAQLTPLLRPGEGYLRIVDRFGESVAHAFALLAEPGALPAVFHCTAGKDRTGIIAALVLEVLGVPENVIAEDYALTEAAQTRSMAWIEANEPDYAAYLAQIPAERRAARPEKIADFLAGVREQFGTVDALLVGLGVKAAALDRLRDALLD